MKAYASTEHFQTKIKTWQFGGQGVCIWQKLRHNSSAHAEIVSMPGRMNKEHVYVIKLVYLCEQMMQCMSEQQENSLNTNPCTA